MTIVLKTVRQCKPHWIHTMILILGENLLAIKLHLIVMSFLTMPTSSSYVNTKVPSERLQKPGEVFTSTGASTFATAKSNNSGK